MGERWTCPLLLLVASFAWLPAGVRGESKTGVGLEKISLPSGPGSIEGLGDAFEPQLNSGTSAYSVKIAAPPGVAGLQPDVVLRYNSGGGNGPFGIAWTAGFMAIQRQTEKGLPIYGDQDAFTLGGEELVPLSDGSYRAENESSFQRIVRDGSGWIVFAKNGTRYFLGSTAMTANPSRIVRPGVTNPTFADTFKWCVDTVIDVHGNRMEYRYETFVDSPGETYCGEIRYSIFGGTHHAIRFVYEPRPDAFSSYLSGFEVRTARRCREIRVESGGSLVRRYGLGYTLAADDPIETVAPTDAGLSFSLLRQVTQFDRSGGDDHFLPPLRLGYTRFDVAGVTRGTLANTPPFSLGNPNVSLSDLNADALPDVLYTDPVSGRHSVYYNEGFGEFSQEVEFVAQPTGVTLDNPSVQLADLDGDGRIDLVQKAGGANALFSYYPNTTLPRGHDESRPSWGAEVAYATPYPPFDLDDPSVRSLDLNNDKRIDYMRTTPAGFVYYYNRGDAWEEDGLYLFGEPQMGNITFADALDFESGGQSNVHVKLADMNGDRLLDLVRIRLFGTLLEVDFWPNRGRGHWGNRIGMAGGVDLGVSPIEDVFVRDLNGDGIADLLVPSYDFVSYWINLGNNGFSGRFAVSDTPEYIRGTTVLQQADINGNGSTDLLWENFDPGRGNHRIDYVDFLGGAKPNLLQAIDNGIGLLTRIGYGTTTEFYLAAREGGNPWSTRLPFPSTVVTSIRQSFGLDLDALPGQDVYLTEFSYHDGYYDPFEKEFRGFAFARKVERGDDRLSQGGPAPEVNSPSTVTRLAFHTGVPDGIDNDGDNLTDEFDPVAGYEEEALKGKVLWTEVTRLTEEFDQLDNDGDGFIDEADEGPGSGHLAPDSIVFTREYQTWNLKTIHDPSGGFAEVPQRTLSGQKVTFPFAANQSTQVIDAVGSVFGGDPHGTPTSPVTTTTVYDVDHFGNATLKQEFGVTSGGGLAYDDERFTTTRFVYNLAKWIVGLPYEELVTDEGGAFVSRKEMAYDGLGVGSIGNRGLLTAEIQHVGSGAAAITAFSKVNGDPRGGGTVTTRYGYDAFGNPTRVEDPLHGAAPGHVRIFAYDPIFHTYVTGEQIDTGGPGGILAASATYDTGGGVITSSTDFNGNASTYLYDRFYRITGIVKPGDSVGAPTQVFEYRPTDRIRQRVYVYDSAGNLSLSTDSGAVTSRVIVRSRETAGGGTFDIVQITDGAGHKLGTIEEGESPGQWVYKDVKRYTSRGHERDTYLPFFGGSPAFVEPPVNGDRVTQVFDALGRTVRAVNPPETDGGPRTFTVTEYRPLKQTLFDEEDTAGGLHSGTPHVQYRDGLDRLVGVDELVEAETWPTRYDYDLRGNLVGITDSQANRKWMRYDGLGRMIFMEDPDRGKMFYTYDAASNLISTEDAKGQIISMTYDGANRILTEDYLDARGLTPDVAYHYDAPVTVPDGHGGSATSTQVLGKLARVVDLSGEEVLSYDARGRTAWKIKRVPDPVTGLLAPYQSGFAYDSLDRLTALGYPDGDAVSYDYNSRNLPETIGGGPGGTIIGAIDYLASGQLASCSYGNGVTTGYQYDPRLRLRNLNTTGPGGAELIRFAYSFDGASNITRIDDLRNLGGQPEATARQNTQVFGYDDLYRLTSVNYPGNGGQIAYGYDRIGNMVSQTSGITHLEKGLSVTNLGTMSYGGTAGRTGRQGRDGGGQPGPHALTGVSEGGRVYPYDANGNMTNIDGLVCTWDFKDRLVAVENAEMRAEYSYDYTDRRITKKVFPKTGGQPSLVADTTLYIDRTFEIREDGAIVKYVWNGETRVARFTRQLGTNLRTQRFRLREGWNLCTLAVGIANAGTQFGASPVLNVFRYDPATQTYHLFGPTESLPAGTLLRVRAGTAGELSIRGTPAAAGAVNYPAGRHWIGNASFQPVSLTAVLPAETPFWRFNAVTQGWSNRFVGELAGLGEVIDRIEPGEAIFAVPSAPFTIAAADPTLEVRYYHQDHIGSSSVMTDTTGQLVSESTFYPFGHPRTEHEPRNVKEAYGFTQKERDGESGLSYFSRRFDSSGLARFLSVDAMVEQPTGVYLADPQLIHSYSYCGNRPIICIDPTGLSTKNAIKKGEICQVVEMIALSQRIDGYSRESGCHDAGADMVKSTKGAPTPAQGRDSGKKVTTTSQLEEFKAYVQDQIEKGRGVLIRVDKEVPVTNPKPEQPATEIRVNRHALAVFAICTDKAGETYYKAYDPGTAYKDDKKNVAELKQGANGIKGDSPYSTSGVKYKLNEYRENLSTVEGPGTSTGSNSNAEKKPASVSNDAE
jgi:RHS repeat-associated protein